MLLVVIGMLGCYERRRVWGRQSRWRLRRHHRHVLLNSVEEGFHASSCHVGEVVSRVAKKAEL